MRSREECLEALKEVESGYKNLLSKFNIKEETIFDDLHLNISHLDKIKTEQFTKNLDIIKIQKGMLNWFLDGGKNNDSE